MQSLIRSNIHRETASSGHDYKYAAGVCVTHSYCLADNNVLLDALVTTNNQNNCLKIKKKTFLVPNSKICGKIFQMQTNETMTHLICL